MNKKKKQIILIIAIVLILAIAGGVLWMAMDDNTELPSNDYTEEEDSQTNENGGEEEATLEDEVEYAEKKYEYNEHLSNYLFLGIDTKEEIKGYNVRGGSGQSDAIYLVSFDRVKNTVKVLSIPRDSMVQIHTYAPDGTDLGYSEDHISIQFAFGDGKDESCRLVKEAVSKLLYGMPIQGYCAVNMDAIPVIAKALGGVEVVVPNSSLESKYPEFKEGTTVTITEVNAETFVRYRDITVDHSAITRTERQKVFLKASAEKAQTLVAKEAGIVGSLYESLQPYMVTNMGNDVFVKLSQAAFDTNEKIQDIPGEKVTGTNYDEYHVNDTQLYELILQMFYEVQDD